MFDLTNILSLNFIEQFLIYSKKPVIILGNKSDLIKYVPPNEYKEHPI